MKSLKSLFNPEYWDCVCEENYIHIKPSNYCPKCGSVESLCPDSWVHEVELLYEPAKDSAISLNRKNLQHILVKRIKKSNNL